MILHGQPAPLFLVQNAGTSRRSSVMLSTQSPRHPLPMRVAHHDACHLRHAQGIYEQLRAAFSPPSPAWKLTRLTRPASAVALPASTTFSIPNRPVSLASEKWGNLLATQSQAVISANPGCLLQLMSGLAVAAWGAMPAFHMVELLDASIRGVCSKGSSSSEEREAVTLSPQALL